MSFMTWIKIVLYVLPMFQKKETAQVLSQFQKIVSDLEKVHTWNTDQINKLSNQKNLIDTKIETSKTEATQAKIIKKKISELIS